MKFQLIQSNRSTFSVEKMCQLLEVSKSGYYKWFNKPISKREKEKIELTKLIKTQFKLRKGRYGSPRIIDDLLELGIKTNIKRIAKIMRIEGLFAINRKRFKVHTTDSNHNLPISPNLLNQNFHVDKPNQVWVSDITYIKSAKEQLYQCSILDLYNREVVGWQIGNQMETSLIIEALEKAVLKKKPGEKLIFHSDRGSQYASEKFRDKLKEYKMIQSMSRKGNCYDNAVAESFFHTLKVEEVYRYKYKNIDEARKSLFEYIDIFYNRIRKHSYLNYKRPYWLFKFKSTFGCLICIFL